MPTLKEMISKARFHAAHGEPEKAASIYRLILDKRPNTFPAMNGLWELRRAQIRDYDFRSGSGQDEFLFQNIFKTMEGGFFVDIGAYDGMAGSNTWFFEKTLHWGGICIEPSPRQFEKLVRKRSCICYNTCVSDFEGETEFFDIQEGKTQMGGIVKNYQSGVHDFLMTDPDTKGKLISSKVTRLSTILDQEGISNIDYCSIDVEGTELNILYDIDFDKYSINVISVENNCNNRKIREHLTHAGYELITTVSADEIYKKK